MSTFLLLHYRQDILRSELEQSILVVAMLGFASYKFSADIFFEQCFVPCELCEL